MDITVREIKALLERLQRGGAATTEDEGAATGAAITDRERAAAQRLLPRDPGMAGAAFGVGDEFQEFLGGLGAVPDGALIPGDNQVPTILAPVGPNKRPPTEDELMADRRREMVRAMGSSRRFKNKSGLGYSQDM